MFKIMYWNILERLQILEPSWKIEGFTLSKDVYIIWKTKGSVSAFKLKHAGWGQKVPLYVQTGVHASFSSPHEVCQEHLVDL